MGSLLMPRPISLSPFMCLILLCLTSFPAILMAEDDDTQLTPYEVLQQYDFPVGVVPKSVIGYELDRSTGKFTGYLNGSCSFSLIGSYQLRYQSTITGYISKDKLTQLKGVTVKVLLFWLKIVEVVRSNDELQFSVGIASASYAIENFLESPQCGCGFECDDELSKEIEGNRFVSAS
ncbi:uncharacterized protein At5g01610-like [Macadamia integrifolia]|uniref:uncharacterized protein At5g01610-like n=1 Tax=Macadamia integrifolia TaxID=60698 RepID=UPI001C52DB5B|nr:uncharacterized protein At5g01610-like [Macadamia integrifolia]